MELRTKDPRGWPREKVHLSAHLLITTGSFDVAADTVPCVIEDLSASGARVCIERLPYWLRARFEAQPSDLKVRLITSQCEPIAGKTVWVHRHHVGIAFDQVNFAAYERARGDRMSTRRTRNRRLPDEMATGCGSAP